MSVGGGTFDPCVDVLAWVDAPAVAGGTACSGRGDTALVNPILAAGTYFVRVSESGNSETGDYTLLYRRPE